MSIYENWIERSLQICFRAPPFHPRNGAQYKHGHGGWSDGLKYDKWIHSYFSTTYQSTSVTDLKIKPDPHHEDASAGGMEAPSVSTKGSNLVLDRSNQE